MCRDFDFAVSHGQILEARDPKDASSSREWPLLGPNEYKPNSQERKEGDGLAGGGGVWTYHGRQGGVQAGFSLAVIGIAVLVTAAVVDEAYLEVHPTLQPGQKQTGQEF